MSPNKFAGTCRECKKRVEPGAGFFERHGGEWWTRHRECTKGYKEKVAQGYIFAKGKWEKKANEAHLSR